MIAAAVAAAQPEPSALMQAQAWKAAQDFEAVALDQFLTPMFATVDLSAGAFGGGAAEQTWQSMFVTELGKQMQRSGGIGLARSVYTEMLRLQEAGRARPAAAAKPLPVQETLP